ncbi:MAG: KH domain-containing protein [Deltaproteobacteria bacterium]|nr:KH domain-containing protein [Deltaproteobacteria bacterium]
MKELVEYIARALVDNPEAVLELKVSKEDLGKVIGRQGRTARAMRTILNAASTKLRKRSVLEILE